jgi:hypothetical protein
MIDLHLLACWFAGFFGALSAGIILFPLLFKDWYELFEMVLLHVSPGLLSSLDGDAYFSWHHPLFFALYLAAITAAGYYAYVGVGMLLAV